MGSEDCGEDWAQAEISWDCGREVEAGCANALIPPH